MEKKCNVYNVGLLLLMFMTFSVVVTSILLFFGISVSWLSIGIPLGICLIFFASKMENSREVLKLFFITGVIFVLCVYFAGVFFDTTWDGAAYHKQAVGLLREGWNPVYMDSFSFNDLTGSVEKFALNPLQWSEVYPKSTWYLSAAIYMLTGNIETGKAVTLLFMVVTYCFVFDFLKLFHFNIFTKVFISLLTSFNPVALAQFRSYYIDGVAACVLILLMFYLPLLLIEDYHQTKKDRAIIIAMLIVWGCNLKFSILYFTALYCVIIFVIDIIRNKKISIQLFNFFAGSALFSLTIVGFAPYVTNIIRYKNPFYGFIGAETWFTGDRIDAEFGVKGLNNASRFILSLFGKMSHGTYNSINELLKIPFTFFKEELPYYTYVDTRVGGFGIFFSAIFVISILLLCIWYLRKKETLIPKIYSDTMLVFLILSFGSMLLLPGTYSARYIGQLYIIVIWAIILLADRIINKREMKVYFAIVFMIILCVMNLAPWIKNTKDKIVDGIRVNAELIKMAQKNVTYDVAFYSYDFNGLQYNLKDYGIKYDILTMDELGDNANVTYTWWIYYKEK